MAAVCTSSRLVGPSQICHRISKPSLRSPVFHKARPLFAAQVVCKAVDRDDLNYSGVATYILDNYASDYCTIGLGTGPGIGPLLQELSSRISNGNLKDIKIVPSSDVTASECAFYGVPLTTQDQLPYGSLTVFVDVADELDTSNGALAYVIGRGENGPQGAQASITNAQVLASCAASKIVIAATETSRLEGELPIEILADDWEEIAEELDDIFVGDAELRRRSLDPNAPARGGDRPVVTPEGTNIIDVIFYGGFKLFSEEEVSYAKIAAEIESVPGVVAHGLMWDVANVAVIAQGKDQPPKVVVAAKEGQ